MGVGRFFCVGLPLALTIASIIALLIATLSGVAHNQLWMFQLDTRNLSISPVDAAHLAGKAGLSLRDLKTDNITAADLNLADTYDVNLWGYCSTTHDGQRQCTKASFDWAATALNASVIETLNSTTGLKIELPHEMEAALRTFRTVTKWTEVAFIIALVALALQLVVGIFAMCSRAVSCLTWLLSGVTGILVGVAAGMATAMATVVIGAVESSAKYYGVEGHVGGRFLATVWIAALFAIVSGLFWIFTVCCCKPERRQKRCKNADGEKLLPTGAYKPISGHRVEMTGGQSGHPAYYDPNQAHAGYSSGPRHAAGHGRANMAYEPYSHRA
ncbi:uncharacterized protein CPUR_03637 [Claviceps purpurea 20.1]|uniref:Integral membrane protein n=1 Tax=Claviceps purpurea (strain 20.1) TaxID=1111077 RepID=M1W5A2_CLAP2|nr:hypothetical protein E4U46_007768 [Claviceps purpurea]CCE29790.1 uncharacterized protein CPUR_03637 [Claviceps purpurea 20.1]